MAQGDLHLVPPRERWLSVADVAKTLQLPPSTIYRAVKRGQIPAIKIGRQFRIRPSVLDQIGK